MAHTKAGGSTQLGRDSKAKRLGVKLFGGEQAKAGSVLVRQRGTKYHPGENVRRGEDDSLYAVVSGFVRFSTRKLKKFNGKFKKTRIVSVEPESK